MDLENIVELERPIFSEIVAWPLACWLLYSFLTQIFLQWVGLEKEYRKRNRGIKIVKIVDKVDMGTRRLKIKLGGGESPLTL